MASISPETNLDSLLSPENAVTFVFSSESVSEGHPDRVCDFISEDG